MQKIIYLIILLMTFVSCENDMPFNVKENPPKLIVNALFEASKEENEIILSLTGREKTSNIKNAHIDIFVNRVLKEQITTPFESSSADGYSKYKTRIRFAPGDAVKIKVNANDAEYYAESEVIAPHSVSIENVETSVFSKKLSHWGDSYQYLRALTTFTDNRKGINYYRIAMSFDFEIEISDSQNQKDTTVYQTTSLSLIINEDVVLTDGHPSVSENNNDIYTPIYNKYGVFDNSRINGAYTMTTSMQIPYLFAGFLDYSYFGYESNIKRIKAKARIKLLSINREQYLYLKALNIYDSIDYDDFLNLPVKFPSNIDGGTGIFGISTGNEVVIPLDDYVPNAHNKY